MSKQIFFTPIKNAIDNFAALDYQAFKANPGTYQPWNNFDVNDFFQSYEDFLDVLKSANENNVFDKIPWNILNALPALLTALHNVIQQLFAQKNQSAFNTALQQLETVKTNFMSWGIVYLSQYGKRLSYKEKLIDEQIAKLLTTNKEIETIKQNVQKLIEPAVAGSLSKSFEDRKNALAKKQSRWFWLSVSSAIIGIIATVYVVTSIVGVFSNDLVLEALKDSAKGSEKILWPTMFLRIGILFPIFSFFYFSFNQYKKERDLEEEYAHKEAVATSLPNYGNLAVDTTVKDQILSEASKVIFMSPIHFTNDKEQKSKDGLEQVNSMLGNIQKLIPKANG
jgi:hypothetical protein